MKDSLRHSMPWAKSWCLLPIMASVLILGCSDPGARRGVTGSVAWNGEPLPGGWVYFRPLGEGPSSAGEITDGAFKIAAADGLMPGEYKVSIEYRMPTGRKVKVYTGEMIDEERQIIPPRYNEQTTLTTEIQSTGRNHLTFELKSDD